MSITIDTVGLSRVSISFEKDSMHKISGEYELKTATGMSIAKQGFNGYNDTVVELSSETIEARNAFLLGVQNDVKRTIGMGE